MQAEFNGEPRARAMGVLKGRKIQVVVGSATHSRPFGRYDREADDLVAAMSPSPDGASTS